MLCWTERKATKLSSLLLLQHHHGWTPWAMKNVTAAPSNENWFAQTHFHHRHWLWDRLTLSLPPSFAWRYPALLFLLKVILIIFISEPILMVTGTSAVCSRPQSDHTFFPTTCHLTTVFELATAAVFLAGQRRWLQVKWTFFCDDCLTNRRWHWAGLNLSSSIARRPTSKSFTIFSLTLSLFDLSPFTDTYIWLLSLTDTYDHQIESKSASGQRLPLRRVIPSFPLVSCTKRIPIRPRSTSPLALTELRKIGLLSFPVFAKQRKLRTKMCPNWRRSTRRWRATRSSIGRHFDCFLAKNLVIKRYF